MLIPSITAAITDYGMTAGDFNKVIMYGGIMLLCAIISLFFGIRAGCHF